MGDRKKGGRHMKRDRREGERGSGRETMALWHAFERGPPTQWFHSDTVLNDGAILVSRT